MRSLTIGDISRHRTVKTLQLLLLIFFFLI
jgi:hypothetical protein